MVSGSFYCPRSSARYRCAPEDTNVCASDLLWVLRYLRACSTAELVHLIYREEVTWPLDLR